MPSEWPKIRVKLVQGRYFWLSGILAAMGLAITTLTQHPNPLSFLAGSFAGLGIGIGLMDTIEANKIGDSGDSTKTVDSSKSLKQNDVVPVGE